MINKLKVEKKLRRVRPINDEKEKLFTLFEDGKKTMEMTLKAAMLDNLSLKKKFEKFHFIITPESAEMIKRMNATKREIEKSPIHKKESDKSMLITTGI
jgi:hypothetical protein